MYAAYEDLSISMRNFLAGLTAIHDGRRNYDGRQTAPSREAEYPRAEHPVVRTHPITGRNALFVNRMFTTRIVQLKEAESIALLEEFHAWKLCGAGSVYELPARLVEAIFVLENELRAENNDGQK